MARETYHDIATQQIIGGREEQLANQRRYAESLVHPFEGSVPSSDDYNTQMARVAQTEKDIECIKVASGLRVNSRVFSDTARGIIDGVPVKIVLDYGQNQSALSYRGTIDGVEIAGDDAKSFWETFGRPAKAIYDRAEFLKTMSVETSVKV